MSRYDLQTQSASPSAQDGDLRFLGLNAKYPRETLAPGMCARLENKRLVRGAETRPGTRTPVFANLFAKTQNLLIGAGVYSNPNGNQLGLLAKASLVLGIRAGTVPLQITVQDNFASPSVEFTQHFDKVLAHQSNPNDPTLIWDGLSPDDGFIPILDPSVIEPGIKAIPNPPYSVNYLDRAWFPIPGVNDSIGASDINDPTTYDSDLHTFRVNTGTSDAIVGIYPYLGNNLIIGKERSIDILYNIPDDLGDAYIFSIQDGLSPASPPPPQVHSISDEIGIYARKSGIIVAGRFMFLSSAGGGGIYQITTDQHGNYIVDATPVSDSIEPIIKRINWGAAKGAVGIVAGIRAYWAVPLDDCQWNNAMLVYNLATSQWESLDLWNALPRERRGGGRGAGPGGGGGGRTFSTDNPMRMDNLIRLNFYGTSEIFAVNQPDQKVHLLYQGADDQLDVASGRGVENQTYPIQDVFESRGYSSGMLRESKAAWIGLGTLAPTLAMNQIIDGSDGDEIPLQEGPIIRDREKYEVTIPDFILNNSNDDFEDPSRQDYSVQLGDGILLQDDGVRIQRLWPWTRELSLDESGFYISFRITNSTGLCQVRNIIFESAPTRSTKEAV